MRKKIATYIKTSIATITMAMFAFSCEEVTPPPTITDPETTPTKISRNLISMESQDGMPKHRFETPLLEEFDQAKEPYVEFKHGLKVETFAEDSVTIQTDLVADYVHYNKTKKLWEARGNVIARNLQEDKTLYTEQLYWDEVRKKIYTDKPAKIIDRGNVHRGLGFEADQDFKSWQFNKARGSIELKEQKDSTQGTESVTIPLM